MTATTDWKTEDRDRGAVNGRACIFAALLPALRSKARELGYALGLHGSMVRDLDLIAAPWVDEAVEADVLAKALQDVLGGWVPREGHEVLQWAEVAKKGKPHGRVAYTLRFGGDDLMHVDLSVMPRRDKAHG